MVRRMKLTGRTGLWAIGLLVAVAAAAVLGSHRFTPTRKPMGARCPQDPRVALACYEERYRSIVAAQGVAEAFADLKAGYGTDPEMQRLCHAITHAIGQAAVTKYGDVATAFRYGDNACGSGYYHGVMQGFALTRGRTQLLSDLDAVCAAVPGKERKSLDYFNCVHGLGHAIMAVRSDALFDALQARPGSRAALVLRARRRARLRVLLPLRPPGEGVVLRRRAGLAAGLPLRHRRAGRAVLAGRPPRATRHVLVHFRDRAARHAGARHHRAGIPQARHPAR